MTDPGERLLRGLLTQHRVMIQRLLLELDRLRAVAECAPQKQREGYEWSRVDDLNADANGVLMLEVPGVRVTPGTSSAPPR